MKADVFPRILRLFSLSCLFLAPGCSSLIMQAMLLQGEWDHDEMPVLIYSGVQVDIVFITEGSFTHAGPCTPPALLGVLELPFSLCMDTALLPLTVPETLALAVHRSCSHRKAE